MSESGNNKVHPLSKRDESPSAAAGEFSVTSSLIDEKPGGDNLFLMAAGSKCHLLFPFPKGKQKLLLLTLSSPRVWGYFLYSGLEMLFVGLDEACKEIPSPWRDMPGC